MDAWLLPTPISRDAPLLPAPPRHATAGLCAAVAWPASARRVWCGSGAACLSADRVLLALPADRVLGVLALLAVLARPAARLPAALAALAEARAAAARMQRVLGLRRTLRRLVGPPGPGAAVGHGRDGGDWGAVELRDATVGWLAVGAGTDGLGGGRDEEGGVTAGGVGGTWAVLEGMTLRLRPGACTVVCGAGKTALLLALAVSGLGVRLW
jgi:hypothetical protein